jgi:hypothetical protein
LVLFAFKQGEVCTCPSRALIQESIYDKFMERVLKRVAAIHQRSVQFAVDEFGFSRTESLQLSRDTSAVRNP